MNKIVYTKVVSSCLDENFEQYLASAIKECYEKHLEVEIQYKPVDNSGIYHSALVIGYVGALSL